MIENTQEHVKNPRPLFPRILSVAWKVALFCLLFPIVQVIALKWIDPPLTAMMLWNGAGNLFSGESISCAHSNKNFSDVSPSFYRAVVAGEDQRFFEHKGFDWQEIENAQDAHKRHPKRPMRGASTISQQVAKNLFLPPVHSFIRKGIEAYYTVLIEFFWSKQRILEMYGNIAQFAPNVYGVEAASQYHFHKPASRLSPAEASQLAAVLPNPERWSASRPSSYIQRRAARIQRQMRGIPTDEDEDGEPD